jgi:hypothetical protein
MQQSKMKRVNQSYPMARGDELVAAKHRELKAPASNELRSTLSGVINCAPSKRFNAFLAHLHTFFPGRRLSAKLETITFVFFLQINFSLGFKSSREKTTTKKPNPNLPKI